MVNRITGFEGNLNGEALVSFGLNIAHLLVLIPIVSIGIRVLLERLAVNQNAHIDMIVRRHRKKTLSLSRALGNCGNDERNTTKVASYCMHTWSSETGVK